MALPPPSPPTSVHAQGLNSTLSRHTRAISFDNTTHHSSSAHEGFIRDPKLEPQPSSSTKIFHYVGDRSKPSHLPWFPASLFFKKTTPNPRKPDWVPHSMFYSPPSPSLMNSLEPPRASSWERISPWKRLTRSPLKLAHSRRTQSSQLSLSPLHLSASQATRSPAQLPLSFGSFPGNGSPLTLPSSYTQPASARSTIASGAGLSANKAVSSGEAIERNEQKAFAGFGRKRKEIWALHMLRKLGMFKLRRRAGVERGSAGAVFSATGSDFFRHSYSSRQPVGQPGDLQFSAFHRPQRSARREGSAFNTDLSTDLECYCSNGELFHSMSRDGSVFEARRRNSKAISSVHQREGGDLLRFYLYGLEKYWPFHFYRKGKDVRPAKHPELAQLLEEEFRCLEDFQRVKEREAFAKDKPIVGVSGDNGQYGEFELGLTSATTVRPSPLSMCSLAPASVPVP